MKKVYNLYRKNKKVFGILFLITGVIGSLFFEKYYVNRPFSLDRMLIYIFFLIFISLNIMFDIKELWQFIYKKRYVIGIIIFSYIVLMGYNGSSFYTFNESIEPNYITRDMVPIIGKNRPIKSDEYRVNTPTIFSQYIRNKDFNEINNAIMGRETNVLLYPALQNSSIAMLTRPALFGFLFFDLEQAYSFYYYFDYFVLFFALFELFMILTKKNKLLSLTGTIMLEFSPLVLWWTSLSILMYGSLATIFFYYLLSSKEKWKKILFSSLLGWSGACYIMTLYPAWMVPYGYLFLVLFIYMIYLNRKKIHWTNFLYLIISICVMCGLLLPIFINAKDTLQAMMNTEYPGARTAIGGSGWKLYFNYFSSIFYSIYDVGNPCEYSQFLSFYPLPIILGLIYTFKDIREKKKPNILIILLCILAVLLSIWNYMSIGIIAKVFLLTLSMPERTQVVVNAICIFILILVMNDYIKEKKSNKLKLGAFIFSILLCVLGLYICHYNFPDYMTVKKTLMSFIVFFLLFYLICINTQVSVRIFCFCMILFGSIFFITIHPINKGVTVITEKPLSKEIQLLNSLDKDKLWVTISSNINLQSYILANGARVLNSVNYYPNMDLWKKLDPNGDYNYVYNRYAHIEIEMTEQDTNFELLYADFFRLNINKNDVCKLGANYIATMNPNLNEKIDNLNKIYQYSNVAIYELDCNG